MKKIVRRTFQKALNLYLYIPQHSAHPPGMIKGVVFGLLQTYKWQNSLRSDFLAQAKDLFNRLVARGWDHNLLCKMFINTIHRVDNPPPHIQNPTEELNNKQMLFFHMQYHPYDIPRNIVRKIYTEECEDYFRDNLDIQRYIVAYSRPENIWDITTSSTLHQAQDREVSTFENRGS